MPNYISHSLYITIIVFSMVLTSCYERQEGCLDINASNYDFTADDPCEDCCSYPTMKISVTHMWGDTFLINNSVYSNDLDQYIKIISSKFYLSDFVLSNSSGNYRIEEVMEVQDENNTITEVYNDFIFVQSNRVSYTVGTFPVSDIYDDLSFTMGINGDYVAADSTKSFVEDNSFFDADLYQHTNFRLDYIIDTISMDTLQLNIKGESMAKNLSLNSSFEIPLGRNFTISLQAHYDLLLSGLDLNDLESEAQINRLKSNLDHFFSF